MSKKFNHQIIFAWITIFILIIFPAQIIVANNGFEAEQDVSKIQIVQLGQSLNFFNPTAKDTVAMRLKVNGNEGKYLFSGGFAKIEGFDTDKKGRLLFIKNQNHYSLYHISQGFDGTYRIRNIPLWLSVIPPLLAILLALLFKEVVLALFLGLFSGVFIAGGLRIDSFQYFFLQFFNTVTDYLVPTLTDFSHMAVIVFSLIIGGMVAIISKNGGMAGVVSGLSKYAKTPVSTQIIAWMMGIAIFFDDYANTLIVGNTMKSISDKFRISREKLAYIVDSTAAPVAATAFITTWIGAELGYIGDGILTLEGIDPSLTPYSLFLKSLSYAYYPFLTLIFVFLVIILKKEFGPMYIAEENARKNKKTEKKVNNQGSNAEDEHFTPAPDTPLRWFNAVLPVISLVIMTILGLIVTGMQKSFELLIQKSPDLVNDRWSSIWQEIPILTGSQSLIVNAGFVIGNADSFTALLWGSLTGLTVAIYLSLAQRLLKVNDTFITMTNGFKSMMPALMILALAWSLAKTTQELHTAEFITSALEGLLRPELMPALVFVISGLISFSTGSSWSTMAILFPIALPASWTLSIQAGMSPLESTDILVITISAIMGASVMGDHASPISDTTIMSSLASGCDHVQHVRTQLPYALTVGVISFILTLLSAFYVNHSYFSAMGFPVSILMMYMIVSKFGKKISS
ncbi:MAG TPA: sodium:proton antiporter [Saprospirales bacterium]|nr:sodium:proton antiporter [Saprospirales bacterium]